MKAFVGFVAAFVILWLLFWVLPSFRIATSEQNISGIVYNVSNDDFISGNSHFSVRAAVDTLVTDENESSYCLPGNSPYKTLINKAAEDKNVRVIVRTKKMFYVAANPLVCADNVVVTQVK